MPPKRGRQGWGVRRMRMWRGEEEGGEDGALAANRGVMTAGAGRDGALRAPGPSQSGSSQ